MNQQTVLKRFGMEGKAGLQDVPTWIEGRFRIDSQIGFGAFGKVFRAHDRETGESVAVKLFDERLDETGYLQELGLLFSEEHPNLVRTISFGYASGQKYIVYEFVRGGSLRDYLIRNPRVATTEALTVLRDVCLGLEFAHGRRVVHRDLKPENLLLTSPDCPFEIKICDFGLSTRFRPGSKITSYFGSPAYMAPEQFGDQYDHRIDLYAAGVILYEMLFGRRPHSGDAVSLKHAHVHVEPPMPVSGPPKLLHLLTRLMAKNPDDRYQNARDVLQDVNALLTDEPLHADALPVPRNEAVTYSTKWSYRLPMPCSGYQLDARHGLILGLQDAIVGVDHDGQATTLVETTVPVTEFVEGGDPSRRFGWTSGEDIWVWDDGHVRMLEGGCEVPQGARRLLWSPDLRCIVVASATHVDLVDATDGTVMWRAEVATYGTPPEVCFDESGECVWIASEAPRTQLVCLSLAGDKRCRTAAPGADAAMVAGPGGGIIVGTRGRKRLSRLNADGFVEGEIEMIASLVELHAVSDRLCAVWSHKHVELIDRRTLASYALLPRPDEHERVLMSGAAVVLMELERQSVVLRRFELERMS